MGNSSVGKTSLINRAMGFEFNHKEDPTIGASWHLFSTTVGGELVEFQLWDTAGQERYRALGPLYYRSAVAGLVVYDITARGSFEAVQSWINAFTEAAGTSAIVIVVGNKADLDTRREVTEREGGEWAESRGLDWFEASAKTGQNIAAVFERMAERVVTPPKDAEFTPKSLDNTKELDRGCC
jgi:small GTP-binding protein